MIISLFKKLAIRLFFEGACVSIQIPKILLFRFLHNLFKKNRLSRCKALFLQRRVAIYFIHCFNFVERAFSLEAIDRF